MRPLIALLLSASILAGVYVFLRSTGVRPSASPSPEVVEVEALGEFEMEITLSFDAEDDAFNLNPASLLVEFRDRELLKRAEPITADEPIRFDVPGVWVGSNEFHFVATPREDQRMLDKTVHVRFLRNDSPIAESKHTFAPGKPVSDKTVFKVSADAEQQK